MKRFRQQECLNYFDTYSPIPRITFILILIDITTINKVKIHQIDVKTILLNCNLDEDVYIGQPEGFVVNEQ